MNDNQTTQPERRRRGRNIVGVAVLFATMAAPAAAAAASSGSAAPTAAVAPAVTSSDDARAAQASDKLAKKLRLLTAAPAAVTGATQDGATKFVGEFQLRRFKAQQGQLFAVGRLVGTLGTKTVNQNVSLPVNGAASNAEGPQGFRAPAQTPGACSILELDLGPLDLNLLGLRIFLDEVFLLIEAIPGAGALLGNLLCAVAGLLDGGLGGGLGGLINNLLTAIANLLNGLLGV